MNHGRGHGRRLGDDDPWYRRLNDAVIDLDHNKEHNVVYDANFASGKQCCWSDSRGWHSDDMWASWSDSQLIAYDT